MCFELSYWVAGIPRTMPLKCYKAKLSPMFCGCPLPSPRLQWAKLQKAAVVESGHFLSPVTWFWNEMNAPWVWRWVRVFPFLSPRAHGWTLLMSSALCLCSSWDSRVGGNRLIKVVSISYLRTRSNNDLGLEEVVCWFYTWPISLLSVLWVQNFALERRGKPCVCVSDRYLSRRPDCIFLSVFASKVGFWTVRSSWSWDRKIQTYFLHQSLTPVNFHSAFQFI